MGSCCSKDSIIPPIPVPRRPLRLMLAGPGESGKSTVMKQLKIISGKGFDDRAKAHIRGQVLLNLIEGANHLLEAGKSREIKMVDVESAKKILKYCADNLPRKVEDLNKMGLENLPEEILQALRAMGSDKDFLARTGEISGLQVPDGWSYFLEKVLNDPEWGSPSWIPDEQDVLHVRARTVGINTEKFEFNNRNYEVIDVGGQKAERGKWRQVLRGIDGMIYMQPLSDYDQVLFEDNKTSRFLDSLELWRKTLKAEEFKASAIIIFFNKEDLLIKKFAEQRIPFPESLGNDAVPVPKYQENLSVEKNIELVKNWYQNKLLAEVPEHIQSTDIVIDFVTAIETTRMKIIFEKSIFDTVTGKIMRQLGLPI